MTIIEGRLRIDFLPTAIDFRVIGENGDADVEDALDEIDRLAADVRAKGIAHEVHRRKYRNDYRADAVVVMTVVCQHTHTTKFTSEYIQMERCMDCEAEFHDRMPLDHLGTHRDEAG